MTNILLLGDTHGDRGFTRSALRWAAEHDVQAVYQLGDFGYWPRVNNGAKFLHDVIATSVEVGVPLSFIDGNHEDHLVLQPKAVASGYRPVEIKDRWSKEGHLTYLPRGYSWEVDGVRFGAFGGAVSIDRRYRSENHPHFGWFTDEVSDPDRIDALGHVDVLLTHDAPIIPPCVYGGSYKDDPLSRTNQKVVYSALVRSKARQVFHGHWHLNHRYGVHGAEVQGLAMNADGLAEAGVVYKTEDRRAYSLIQWQYLVSEGVHDVG